MGSTNISDRYPTVSLLPSGSLTLPEHYFCADQTDKTIRNTVPSSSFLVQHASKRIVFDLGMRKVLENYPDSIQPHLKTRQPIDTSPDASDSLRAGGLSPANDVDAVILSHVHYDHVGTPSDFTRAHFIVGHGVRHLLQHGMKYHSAAKFEKDLLPGDRTVELPAQTDLPSYEHPVKNDMPPSPKTLSDVFENSSNHDWHPLGPLRNTIDLFGDGFVYLIDSPGHLVGHLNLLIRTAGDKWVYLAGDACHHARLLTGETTFARWEENGAHVCIHVDAGLAEDTLSRIRSLKNDGLEGAQVEVVFAHDSEWCRDNGGAIFPGTI